jgi:hypothetical protein
MTPNSPFSKRETEKEVAMAATKTASQPTKNSTKALTERPCHQYWTTHPEHTHRSPMTGKEHTCTGTKMSWPEYQKALGNTVTNTYAPKVMKDYTKTTKPNGKRWVPARSKGITVEQARAIAFDMHSAQKDKSGHPYHEHLSAVEAGVVVLGGSDEERIAALFHDAVEDDHTTFTHLKEIGCTEHTVALIEAVSKRKSEEQNAYLARIIAAGEGAMRVKVADLLHNTRHDRMQALRDNKQGYVADRLLKKYRPALARLMLELTLIVDEDDQRKLATKPQGSSTGFYSGSAGTKSGTVDKKPQTMSIKVLMAGDWPQGWSAPIMAAEHGNGMTTFTLANGEIRMEAWETGKHNARRVPYYSFGQWTTSTAVVPVKGLDEDDYTAFQANVERAREKKAQGTLPLSTADSDPWAGWAGL